MTMKDVKSNGKIDRAICFMGMFFAGGTVALLGSIIFGGLFLHLYWPEIINWVKNVF